MSNFNHLESPPSYPRMTSKLHSSDDMDVSSSYALHDSSASTVPSSANSGFYMNNHTNNETTETPSSSFLSYSQDVLAYSGIIDRDSHPTYPSFPVNSSSSTNGNEFFGNSPSNTLALDEDAIKLFVGQVPRTMSENDLLPIMEEYGEVHDIIIIRDKVTGIHRGCAFVTYRTKAAAEAAIENMHNQLVLPPSTNPLQVRPAEGQVGIIPVQEHKLFIGMIPRNADDQKIREVFEKYGTIEEVYILRQPATGQSKGCAFLKFNEKQAALKAIADVNGKLVMENGTSPLVVKFADSRKQRIQRAKQHAAETRAMQIQAHQGQGNPYYPIQIPSPYQHPYFAAPGVGGVGSSGGLPNAYMYYNPYAYSPESPIISADAGVAGSPLPPVMTISSPYSSSTRDIVPPSSSTSSLPPPPSVTGLGVPPPLSSKQSRSSSQLEGPMGANLFIYHLPHDITDADLATAFAPYGLVLSAKVYMDKNTGESKGFGFVSYNSPEEASLAIERMNGFQIGSKRLKVQHKRIHMLNEEEDDAYYLHQMNTGAVSSNVSDQDEEKQRQSPSEEEEEEEENNDDDEEEEQQQRNHMKKENDTDEFRPDCFEFTSKLNLS